jgi:hypothetical protein
LIMVDWAEMLEARRRIASAVDEESTKVAKKKKETSEKLSPEPKMAAARKRKTASPEPKALVQEEETPATPSAAEVEEILKVMTEPLPVKLSPLAPELTKFFQKDKEASAVESPALPKKRRIIQIADVIHQTPKVPQPKPPEWKLLKLEPAKPKLPGPKPGPQKVQIWKPLLKLLTIYS